MDRPSQALTEDSCRARLAQLFERNGYVRLPHEERRRELGSKYEKGWEVRLVLNTQSELDEVRPLLERMGLKPGRPVKKSNQWVQPIYGKQAVDLFSAWTGMA